MDTDSAKTRGKGRYEMTGKTSPVAWIVMTIMSLALGYALGVSQPDTLAQEIKIDDVDPKQIPKGSVGPAGRKGVVVYVDVDFRAALESARHMTALHEVMAEKGWTFVDFEPYVENGDLQGFWVTYVAEGGS